MASKPDIVDTFGEHLIGSFIAICLFGVMVVQASHYYETFHDDKWQLKLLIAVICILETGHSIGVVYDVYIINIIFRYQIKDIKDLTGAGIFLLLGGLVTSMVQTFFALRVFRLLPNPWRYIAPFCITLTTARASGTIYLSYEAFTSHSLHRFGERNVWLITALLSVGATIDLIIAISMIYWLIQQRGHLLSRFTRVVDRLIMWTVRSGLLTSLTAIGALIAFQVAPRASYWTALYVCLGKLYATTILSTLNGREQLRHSLTANPSIDYCNSTAQNHRRFTPPFPRLTRPTSLKFKSRSVGPIEIEMSTTKDIIVDSLPHSPDSLKPPSLSLQRSISPLPHDRLTPESMV